MGNTLEIQDEYKNERWRKWKKSTAFCIVCLYLHGPSKNIVYLNQNRRFVGTYSNSVPPVTWRSMVEQSATARSDLNALLIATYYSVTITEQLRPERQLHKGGLALILLLCFHISCAAYVRFLHSVAKCVLSWEPLHVPESISWHQNLTVFYFPAFYGRIKFHHNICLTLCWARWIQFTPSHPVSILILSSHLHISQVVSISLPAFCIHVWYLPCMPHASPISFNVDHPNNNQRRVQIIKLLFCSYVSPVT
jgi:hypothetical protein